MDTFAAALVVGGAPTTAREGACAPHSETQRSCRFGPHKSAWDRLGPDIFFFRC
jgi:hypothetical protein